MALNPMTAPEASVGEQSRMELQARLNGLGGLNGRQLSPEAKAKKLREACEGFESIFIQKMWQEMRNAVPKGGLLHSREEGFWQDMYDQELSKSMTKAGGIGLADMMYEQLSRNLVSASRTTAGSHMGGAFTPGAAPLVPQGEMEDLIGGTLKDSPEDIYDAPAPEVATEMPASVAHPEQMADAAPIAAAPMANSVPPLTAEAKPVEAPYGAIPKSADIKPHNKTGADLGQSNGLLQAQKAFREAGDKLGSKAVRPSSATRRQEADQEEIFTSPITQGGLQPGSPEALAAAVEKAKTGAADDTEVLINLHNLVANVQAGNNAANDGQPVVTRVRRTTNIPRSSKTTTKKSNQAIRTLNVNNVGVNSRQGQGLSAYHKQQEAQMAPAAPAGIPPLTGQNVDTAPHNDGFAIPPLTAANARG